ncbi:MAG TPA: ribonuclease HII [Caldilineae bacterium]|jgi:ribonuclease HII|nr:ribonuclease HII [Caldilineae bacterium]
MTEAASLERERALWIEGYRYVAGLDEAGRGAWAGPVVAAAVILPPDPAACAPLLGCVRDSKQLSPPQRESLLTEIRSVALSVGVGIVPASIIDELGIVSATRLAMSQAVEALSPAPDHLLIDALALPQLDIPQQALIHGDASSLSIAAASIVAKVTRDRILVALDARYPGYGFARHKGYGTAAHREALYRLGPCVEHRRSFRPVQEAQAMLERQAR